MYKAGGAAKSRAVIGPIETSDGSNRFAKQKERNIFPDWSVGI